MVTFLLLMFENEISRFLYTDSPIICYHGANLQYSVNSSDSKKFGLT